MPSGKRESRDGIAVSMVEFVTLMALLNALVALAIDGILPALPEIGRDLSVAEGNRTQLVVSVFFLGLAVGQLLAGPLSDWRGRRPVVGLGLVFFALGCLVSMMSSSLEGLLAGRFVQGAGLAFPRVSSMALIRDVFSGDAMARVMSFIMAVFILVPLVAPALGQGILLIADWRTLFAVFLGLAAVIGGWFFLRQAETLAKEDRRSLAMGHLVAATREVLRNRIAMGYVVTAGLVSGAFVGYLSTAQQIFQDLFELGTLFPLAFAALAASIGAAAVVNGRLVERFGMRLMVRWSLLSMVGLSSGYLILATAQDGRPSLSSFMVFMAANLFAVGILFGNLNSLAMEPLGHIAGLGAAMVGSVTTLLSAVLGAAVGLAHDGTVIPLVGAFSLFGVISVGVVAWTERWWRGL